MPSDSPTDAIHERIHERILGGMLGLAAGDALGAPVEFMSPAEIERRHGTHRDLTGGGAFNWRPGQGSDDTDLAWAIVAGYLSTEGATGAPLIEAVSANFLAWFASNPPDVGLTTREALARLRSEGDPSTSGVTAEHSCGNGSLMRTLPTGLVRRDPATRQTESAAISAVTHAHPRCVNSCVAYNEIAAVLLEGQSPAAAIDVARGLELDADTAAALDISPELPAEQLRTSGYVIDSLACAVWAIQQPDSLEDVLVALVNRGDDADTTCAIAGGLLGIIGGPDAIPQRWRERLEYAPKMAEAASRFAQMRAAG